MKLFIGAVAITLLAAAPVAAQVDLKRQLLPAPKERAPNSGGKMMALSKQIHACLDDQVPLIAIRPIDLETASLAAIVRCSAPLNRMRDFLLTGIPNFTPSPDFWTKEIEPEWLNQAKRKVALFRSLMKYPPGASPPEPAHPKQLPKPKIDKQQI